jgi:hypothetical protein
MCLSWSESYMYNFDLDVSHLEHWLRSVGTSGAVHITACQTVELGVNHRHHIVVVDHVG